MSKKKGKEKKENLFNFKVDWNVQAITNNIFFILFVSALILVYIGLNHNADKQKYQYYSLEKQNKELRWEYLTTKNNLLNESKQSEVARLSEPLGLKELTSPPRKILYNNSSR